MHLKKKQQHKPSSITVRGVIEFYDCLDDETPFEAMLTTDDEEEFYLDMPSKNSDARDHIDSYVQVSGIHYVQEGHKVILVKRILPIEPEGEYSDQESDSYDPGYYDDGYDLYDDDEILRDFARFSDRSDGRGFSDEF